MHLRIFFFEVVLDDLKVADAALGEPVPADKAPFMSAGHVDATAGFWRLVFGDLVLHQLAVDKGLTRIERQPDGTLRCGIARGDERADEAPRVPEIHDLRLYGLQVVYRDETPPRPG